MDRDVIISRFQSLEYLGKLKGSTVSQVSKNSKYDDVVKFYAIINTDNVIEKISFQATGCTTFMAMCSFFCEEIEGKAIEKALKVNKANFEKIVKLDEKSEHVYPIIFETFALLIKKYRKVLDNLKSTDNVDVKKIAVKSSNKLENNGVVGVDNKKRKANKNQSNQTSKSTTSNKSTKSQSKSNINKLNKEEIHKSHLTSLQDKIKQKDDHENDIKNISSRLNKAHSENIGKEDPAKKTKKSLFGWLKRK